MKKSVMFVVLLVVVCFSIPSFAGSVSPKKETQKWTRIEKLMDRKIRASDLPVHRKKELIEFFHILVMKKQLKIWVNEIDRRSGKIEVPELPQIPAFEKMR